MDWKRRRGNDPSKTQGDMKDSSKVNVPEAPNDEQSKGASDLSGAEGAAGSTGTKASESPEGASPAQRGTRDTRDTRDTRETRETAGTAGTAGEAAGETALPVPEKEQEQAGADLAKEYLEQLQRLQAEFDNYRKRINREREDWFAAGQIEVVSRLLAVADDLRRAREHGRERGESPDAAGLLLILKRFEDILTQLGLKEQSAEPGLEFDPEQYEAVFTSPSEEIPEGRIVRSMEPGYYFQGRLLRPGKVCVSSGPAAGVERAS